MNDHTGGHNEIVSLMEMGTSNVSHGGQDYNQPYLDMDVEEDDSEVTPMGLGTADVLDEGGVESLEGLLCNSELDNNFIQPAGFSEGGNGEVTENINIPVVYSDVRPTTVDESHQNEGTNDSENGFVESLEPLKSQNNLYDSELGNLSASPMPATSDLDFLSDVHPEMSKGVVEKQQAEDIPSFYSLSNSPIQNAQIDYPENMDVMEGNSENGLRTPRNLQVVENNDDGLEGQKPDDTKNVDELSAEEDERNCLEEDKPSFELLPTEEGEEATTDQEEISLRVGGETPSLNCDEILLTDRNVSTPSECGGDPLVEASTFQEDQSAAKDPNVVCVSSNIEHENNSCGDMDPVEHEAGAPSPGSNERDVETVSCVNSASSPTTIHEEEEILECGTSAKSPKSDNAVETINPERKAPSPMITMIDSNLGDDDSCDVKSVEVSDDLKHLASDSPAPETRRITRARTGALPSRPVRLVEELNDDKEDNPDEPDDPISDPLYPVYTQEDFNHWEYEEGTELTPSQIDPSIQVHPDVLRVTPRELQFYESMFAAGVDSVLRMRLHCTCCGRHVGAVPTSITANNRHKVLRVLVCGRCSAFYGTGKFTKDSDGSELYCRWCGQGGQVVCCSHCPNVFCLACLKRNVGPAQVKHITSLKEWSCLVCNYKELWHYRAICWALLKYTTRQKKEALRFRSAAKLRGLCEDKSSCCSSNRKRKVQPKAAVNRIDEKVQPKAAVNRINETQKSPQILDSPLEGYEDTFASGHFLFPDEDYESENPDNLSVDLDESGEIDPSLFVQPVLEEPTEASPMPPTNLRDHEIQIVPGHTRTISTKSFRGKSITTRPPSDLTLLPRLKLSSGPLRPIAPALRPLAPRTMLQQVRVRGPNVNGFVPGQPHRILVKHPSSLRAGLVPLSSSPTSVVNSQLVILNEGAAKRPVVTKTSGRSGMPNFTNVDGVRSMDQLEGLNSVPWFRDGIDNLRAVGFAVTKRLRDLEARFHTLKNKGDTEKVMALGKKLERLSRKTQVRYKQISTEIQDGCHKWRLSKATKRPPGTRDLTRHAGYNPFNYIEELPSDWDDDSELSRPLEKIMIPVNATALSGNSQQCTIVAVRSSTPLTGAVRPPNLNNTVRVTSRPLIQANSGYNRIRPASFAQSPGLSPSTIRPASFAQSPGLSPSTVSLTSGSADSLKLLNNKSMIDSVGNTVSITLTSQQSQKRKRENSDSESERHLTIPERIKKYNIRPCFVRLQRCDHLVELYLGKSVLELAKELSSSSSEVAGSWGSGGDKDNDHDDEDDDIQIIEEVKSMDDDDSILPTVVSTTSMCETID